MALFKILRGNAANLPKEMKDGYAYFCADTHDFYIDYIDSNGQLTRGQLNAKDADHATNADNATKASKADKLTTGRTIGLKDAVTATATTFDGSSAIDIPITGVKEAYLTWGGKNQCDQIGPLAAALSSEHSANRLAYFNPAGIKFERSVDNGVTWTEVNVTNEQKIKFVTTSNNINICNTTPVSTTQLMRCTITAQDGTLSSTYLYTRARKLIMDVSAPHTIRVKIEKKTGISSSWSLEGEYPIDGWTAWNEIPLSNFYFGGKASQTGNTWQLRLTFAITGVVSSRTSISPAILGLRLFGDTMWTINNNMAKTGHLYSYDWEQNATFPKKVTATALASTGTLAVTGATTLTGALTANGNVILGNATTDTITINGTPTIAAPLTLNSTLTGKENVSLAKDLTVGGNTILGDTSSTDTTTLNSKLTANGTSNFKAAMTATSITASGKVTSSEFVGDLTGNADTATEAAQAQSIAWTYFNDSGTIS